MTDKPRTSVYGHPGNNHNPTGKRSRPANPTREDMPKEPTKFAAKPGTVPALEPTGGKKKRPPRVNFRPDLGPTYKESVKGTHRRGQAQGNTVRTPENRLAVLEMFASGATWRQVCSAIGCDIGTLRLWLIRDPEFMEDYRLSKEMAADFLLDEVQDIHRQLQDESEMTWREDPDLEGGGEWVHPSYERLKSLATSQRTAMEALRMAIEKRAPKRYGQLVKLAGDADNPIQVVVTDYSGAQIEKPMKLIDQDRAEETITDDGPMAIEPPAK